MHRGISTERLTWRTRIARLYRLTIPHGAESVPRLDSMAGIRRATSLTIMVRMTRLTRLPRMIRLTLLTGMGWLLG